jgi:hypothetical protein
MAVFDKKSEPEDSANIGFLGFVTVIDAEFIARLKDVDEGANRFQADRLCEAVKHGPGIVEDDP